MFASFDLLKSIYSTSHNPPTALCLPIRYSECMKAQLVCILIRPALSTKSRRLSQVEVSSVFLGVTESVARRSASSSSLVSADVSEGAGRPPGARGRHVELAHRRAGLVHPGEGQGQRACKFRQFSLHAVTI